MLIDTIPLEDILKMALTKAPLPTQASRYFPTINDIPISRVTYSGNKTIVWFIDGTKCVVKCSANDTYDRQTAIAYALVKRMFGKVGRYDEKTKKFIENEIDGNGIGTKLEKIAANGFDQDAEKKAIKAKKAEARANHLARQKKESDEAFERKARKLAEELRLKKRAEEILQETTLNKTKKVINESKDNLMTAEDFFADPAPSKKIEVKAPARTSGLCQYDSKDAWKFYKRPDKPFSKFTQEEKKLYWRMHNAKRRASK